MKKDVISAIEQSVQKWEKIASGEGEDLGFENCALCQAFPFSDHVEGKGRTCENKDDEICPVQIRSGVYLCRETPYISWRDHQWSHPHFGWVQCDECRTIAQEEVNFLRSLLPKEEVES